MVAVLAMVDLTPAGAVFFSSVGAALQFAYGRSSKIGVVNLLDQAPTVRAFVERALDDRLREYVHARYARDFADLGQLRAWVFAGLPTGVHKGRGVEKMILRHFGHAIGSKSLQRDLRCTTGREVSLELVGQYQRITSDRLRALGTEVERLLEPALRGRGWL